MKKGIHPDNYRLVVFKDMSNEQVFITRSTADTKESIDIDGVTGERIRATLRGRVTYSGWMRGYGRVIIIQHPGNYKSLYAHCSRLLKRRGSYIKTGDSIALVGRSGNAKGSHLHFEYRIKGKAIDPLTVLKGL